MKKTVRTALLVASLMMVPAIALAQERLNDGVLGALAGAVVGGPVGAVVGGGIGYTAGPHISRGFRGGYRHRAHHRIRRHR